jgi:zinc protease
MVEFKKHMLANGLRVIAHKDTSTPMAVFNLLYDVGARDEDPERTGLAHLFEHLMFEGSVNIPEFDARLELAGGESNAFTTNDITSYHVSLPAVNLETAFWLESDRMLGLSFSEEKLKIQKNVVIEEFRQSYLNQPYGDTMLLLRPLAYKIHPYQWATIGKNIDHIDKITLNDVKAFFFRHYIPDKAILSVAGPLEAEDVFNLAEKWFGSIPTSSYNPRSIPQEPVQTIQRRLEVKRNVPASQIFMVFHTCGRKSTEFFATDLLSDVLSNGDSSRLKERLVKGKKLFSEVNAYLSGSIDTGLFIVTGKLHTEVSVDTGEEALWKELEDLMNVEINDLELQKVKNKIEASQTFSESNLMARTMNLAYFELLGNAELLNEQVSFYSSQTASDLKNMASKLFIKDRSTVLHYLAVEQNYHLSNIDM